MFRNVIIGIVIVLVAAVAVYMFSSNVTSQKIENKQLKAVVESVQVHERKTKEVITLPDADLRKRFCKWVRDSEQQCLQADIPIRSGQAD